MIIFKEALNKTLVYFLYTAPTKIPNWYDKIKLIKIISFKWREALFIRSHPFSLYYMYILELTRDTFSAQ
jgi:hypothetical protein